jgi:hypothetical protein
MRRERLDEEHYKLLNGRLTDLERRVERVEDVLAMPKFRAFFPKRLREQDPLERRVRHLEAVIDPLPED